MNFTATVYNKKQAPTKIKISATSQIEAIKKLEMMNYQILSIHPSYHVTFGLKKKFSLDVFTEQLLSLQKAGLSVTEAIKVLAKRENTEQKSILDNMILNIESGKTFSESLENSSYDFPKLYIAAVRSAEQTSNLIESMERYIKYHYQITNIKRRVIAATTYPMVLLFLGISVLLFLLIYVVPQFSLIYSNLKSDLSIATKILLAIGNFLNNYLYLIKFGIVIFVIFLVYILLNSSIRKRALAMIIKTGALQQKVRRHQLSGFYRTFGMLLNSGLPIVQTFNISSEFLSVFPQNQLEKCINNISQGELLSISFENAELGDEIAFSLIRAGEKSGNLSHMMTKIADFYDTDMDIEIERFTRLLEPILMIIIGVMIGAVILIIYVPILGLAENIQ